MAFRAILRSTAMGTHFTMIIIYVYANVKCTMAALSECKALGDDNTCPPGYFTARCDARSRAITGCRPCPIGTYNDVTVLATKKTTCKKWRPCDGDHQEYLWTGNSTSDASCRCINNYRLDTESGLCVQYKDDNAEPSAATEGLKAEGDSDHPDVKSKKKCCAVGFMPVYLHWVSAFTILLIIAVLVLWYWLCWIPAEPTKVSIADDTSHHTKITLEETKEAPPKSKELLSPGEELIGVLYAGDRLPDLLPLTPEYVHLFLTKLLKKPVSDLQEESVAGQGAKIVKKKLKRGLEQWSSDAENPPKFQHILDAMQNTGYGHKAMKLRAEVKDYVDKMNKSLL